MESIETATAAAIYDARSETYDASFHPRQAADFILWAKLKPSQHVLDLACGTGLVALLAKQKVGPQGIVTGVDISSGMLAVAQRKAQRDKLDVDFINCDITDSVALRGLLPDVGEGFDLITCASALVLLKDPAQAIKMWTSFLRPGGRLLVDVPTEDSMLEGAIFQVVGEKLNAALPFDRAWVKDQESLRDILLDAGLQIDDIWKCPSYDGVREHDAEDGEKLFDKLSAIPMYRKLKEPNMAKRAKTLFAEEFRGRAGQHGKVWIDDCFYVAIGRKL